MIAEFAAFPIDALAVVVELGLQPQQAVLGVVALAAERVQFGRPGLGSLVACGLCRRISRCVSFMTDLRRVRRRSTRA